VQPVAIAYQKMLGMPLGRQHRPLVAWYGGTDLLPHLKRVLSEGGIDVNVVFGPAHRLGAGDDRKKTTQEAGEMVRRTVAALNGGRSPEEAIASLAPQPATASEPRRDDRPAEAAE
jgi:1-acyl-sn-glycerol-3-phosphate acyltransferase